MTPDTLMSAAHETPSYASRVRGSLLGGAIGDALGGPVEFWDTTRILGECGEGGVREYVAERAGGQDVFGRITDDTQMTLFTMEGLIRAGVRMDRGIGFTIDVVDHAYDRWLDTQEMSGPDGSRDGWLQGQQWLYSRRAPGNTCLSALHSARRGERHMPKFGLEAQNDSKGCGGVMRSAPFGWVPAEWAPSFDSSFFSAAQAAGYTHGHPTGKLASGALAVIVAALMQGMELPAAVDEALAVLREKPDYHETSAALEAAMAAVGQPATPETVESLGGGWVAEEALAIAVFAALSCPEPEQFLDALALAVTHSGDSDSTGAICGNILGALHGESAIPAELAFELEGRGTMLELADDFVYEFTQQDRLHGSYGPDTRWRDRYPGW
ncbi:ADP-ribosylglycohydrolase family protein [Galactobacter sp.]|uniref:ADP-ribosylglycohydrolase family protein n=1 Tax=Galactobacter sp. TaxID=2676125 RepID=UPI0025C44EB9|nr:ADP-ribosylglycohydrolase family protein [Galactobacter sp.]